MRRKIIRLPATYVFEFFLLHQHIHENMAIPSFSGVPADVKLIDVYYDFASDAFCFKIEHPSFEEVAVGASYPSAEVTYEIKHVELVAP